MIVSIGTDLISVGRIARIWRGYGDRFVNRILTPHEREAWPETGAAHYLARRFCAKEAVAKALGTGMGAGIGWQQIEILHTGEGQPLVTTCGAVNERMRKLGADRIHISISDERDYAVAFAVLAGSAG